jgi:hypothetical protein
MQLASVRSFEIRRGQQVDAGFFRGELLHEGGLGRAADDEAAVRDN